MTELQPRLSQFPEIAFGVHVAREIARVVMPIYGLKQTDVPIHQISKDFNYALDQRAEERISEVFQKAWRKGLVFGYATEDQGMVMPTRGKPEWIFLIDPVDGSRPANIGAENACVNIGIVKADKDKPSLSDVQMGVTLALKERLIFVTRKGDGVYKVNPFFNRDSKLQRLEPRENTLSKLSDASMVLETYCVSAELAGIAVDPLLSEISFKTEYPSGSYAALSVVRGQNDLHIDFRRRLFSDRRDLPVKSKPNFKVVSPMDIAPQFLMLRELGMPVTDAYGRSLDSARLWSFNIDGSWSDDTQLSWVAASTPILHQQAMGKIEEGFRNLSQRYPRH